MANEAGGPVDVPSLLKAPFGWYAAMCHNRPRTVFISACTTIVGRHCSRPSTTQLPPASPELASSTTDREQPSRESAVIHVMFFSRHPPEPCSKSPPPSGPTSAHYCCTTFPVPRRCVLRSGCIGFRDERERYHNVWFVKKDCHR